MDLGVYIHFPWCRARCPYCDFAVAVAPLGDIPHRVYADAILAELRARAPLFAGRELRSIYFGGGTPALWEPREIARVRAAVAETFHGDDLEITVEANPNDCKGSTLARLREASVTRLSIGAQGFDDGDLVFLGRDHGALAARHAAESARRAGFATISLDLIYALPGRGTRHWLRSLDQAVALAPDHLSVYQLTIEPQTAFGQAARAGRLVPAADEAAAEQFEAAQQRLAAAGYQHYEVSSYARPGKRAIHNSLYWSGGEYLGLGNGAHSFRREKDKGLRWAAHRSVSRYLAGTPGADVRGCPLIAETTELDAAAVREDLLWTGLRTSDGAPRALAENRPGLPRLVAAGLVVADGDRIRPTPRGLLFADEIAASLLQ